MSAPRTHSAGKGDFPRNLSDKYKKNYEEIDWKGRKHKEQRTTTEEQLGERNERIYYSRTKNKVD